MSPIVARAVLRVFVKPVAAVSWWLGRFGAAEAQAQMLDIFRDSVDADDLRRESPMTRRLYTLMGEAGNAASARPTIDLGPLDDDAEVQGQLVTINVREYSAESLLPQSELDALQGVEVELASSRLGVPIAPLGW